MASRIHGMDEARVRFPVGPHKCKTALWAVLHFITHDAPRGHRARFWSLAHQRKVCLLLLAL